MNDDQLQSVHTPSFPEVLTEMGVSLLATTYQAGKLIVLRNHAGTLNTHFRNLARPMGLAVDAGRLAVGCRTDILEFHNVPAACRVLDAVESNKSHGFAHDACFLPRNSHCTGDVQVHEMAWAEGELIFANTAFSCLAVRGGHYSFEPIWRPKFIDTLSPGDSCHLNGLAVRDGRVRYVTALGETNSPGGWRDNKRDGGVILDIQSDEIVCQGLSMPHSPRWYRQRLWVLESGDGSIGYVDLATGVYEVIARLPGFTRGLAFVGRFALVGLSQVRESAVFSGIPLVERLAERTCGIWVINLDTGQTVAFCRFEGDVREIFAIEVLAGITFPDVINQDVELISRSYVLNEAALGEVPESLRS